MPFIHLSNGDVEALNDTQWAVAQVTSGTANAFRKDGLEYQVIGVYADAVEHPLSEEELAVIAAKENEQKAAFEKWQTSQNAPITDESETA